MPFGFQVVGCPLSLHRRFRVEFNAFVEAVADRAYVRYSPSTDVDRVVFTAAQLRENFVHGCYHIAVFPTRQNERAARNLSELGVFDYRISRLRFAGDLLAADWNSIEAEMRRVLDFEERWCATVRPSDHNHPLLLPPGTFEPTHTCQDFWRQCDCYSNIERLESATTLLDTVRRQHRVEDRGAKWKDRRDRLFSIDHSAHGRSREDRQGLPRSRFCFTINAGFHFDVVHAHDRRFHISGSDGQLHRSVKRANVDPWGAVRLPV